MEIESRGVEAFPSGLAAFVAAWTLLAAPLAWAAEPRPVSAAPPVSSSWQWQLADEPGTAQDGAFAVAVGPAGAEAVGDAGGVLLRDPRGIWRRLALPGAVRDLAFAPDGSLWVASDEGLYRLDGDRLETPTLAPGDAARRVRRVATGGEAVAAVTEAGVFWSRDGRGFARVDGAFGALDVGSDGDGEEDTEEFGEADSELSEAVVAASNPSASARRFGVGLAFSEPADPAAPSILWIAAPRGLFRARLPARDGVTRIRAVSVRTPAELRPAIDVATGPWGVLTLGEGTLLEGDAAGRQWRVHRPELLPGSIPTRLLVTPFGVLIASDRGLAEAERLGASWRRAGEPAGTTPVLALASDGHRVLAAGSRGLLIGEALSRSAASGSPVPWVETEIARPSLSSDAELAGCDPPIADVRRAALAHLDLSGERTARMWAGVRKRALLPVVTLDGSYAHDRARNRTQDEAFLSNDFRLLHDRDRDTKLARDVELRLVWDLRDLVYHDEEIDVSTEMRRTIELRDDVLDELNQLYFDRRRLLVTLGQYGASASEAIEERLRAEELAAGLDAWTGGWFGPRAGRSRCPPGHP